MKRLVSYVLGAVLTLGSAGYAVAERPTTRPSRPRGRESIYHRSVRTGDHKKAMEGLIEKFKEKHPGLLEKLQKEGRTPWGRYEARKKSDGKSKYEGKRPEAKKPTYDPKARSDRAARIRAYFSKRREETAKKYGTRGKTPEVKKPTYDAKAFAERREKIKSYFEKKREEAKKGGAQKYDPKVIAERIKKARENFAKYIQAREKKKEETKKVEERDSRSRRPSFRSRSPCGHHGTIRKSSQKSSGHSRHPGHYPSVGRLSRPSVPSRLSILSRPSIPTRPPVSSRYPISSRYSSLLRSSIIRSLLSARRPMDGRKLEVPSSGRRLEVPSCGRKLEVKSPQQNSRDSRHKRHRSHGSSRHHGRR
ncbi:hypothetical protein HOA55_04480 [archaeon]|jgi:hypothetical protein|nr:hypothetical protein [archaeon]MBT3577983.1 hypothetical protein [archaeon]MBT6820586.1 hypothetical protein [archaeon]MBT6956521.1 hypothetical protein [archaeon]MBT7025837.1 hypothetical protein [archaeon]